MRVTANDYMSIEIFGQAYGYQERLRLLFFDLIQRVVHLAAPGTAAGEYTIPFPALVNVIERNIDTLHSGGYRPAGARNTATWLGEYSDEIRFTYQDVNRWFETFEQLEALIYCVAYRSLRTGTFTSGINYNRQLIRTVR